MTSSSTVHPEPPIEVISSHNPASSTSSGISSAPALPSRPAALSSAVANTGGSYNSPYSRVGTYGGYGGGYSGVGSSYSGYGGYGGGYGGLGSYSRFGNSYSNGYGGYGGYGAGMMGANPDDPNSLRQTIEAGSQRMPISSVFLTFQLLLPSFVPSSIAACPLLV